jgi:signal transduction histidine kinase
MKLPVTYLFFLFILLSLTSCKEQTDQREAHQINQNKEVNYDFELWRQINSMDMLDEIQKSFQDKNPGNEQLIALHKQLILGIYHFNNQQYNRAVDIFKSILMTYDENISSDLVFMSLMMLTECYIQLEDAKNLALPMTRLEIMKDNISDVQLLVKFHAVMGMANKTIHQNDKSLEHFYAAFDLLDNKDDFDLLISINNSTGLVLHDLRKYEEAIHYYNVAINLAIRHEQDDLLPLIYNNISNSYTELGNFSKAEEFLIKAIEINEREENKYMVIKNYYNLGRLLSDQQKFTSALDYFNRSYELSASLNFDAGLGYSLFGIGSTKILLNQWSDAEVYLRDAEAILRELDDKPILYHTLGYLIQVERKKGNYKEALNIYDDYFRLEQLYHEMAANQRSDELNIKHNVDLVRLQNQILEEKNNSFEGRTKLQRTYLAILIILSLVLFMLFFVALNSKRKTQNLLIETEKQKVKIENQKEVLSQLVTERDALVKTIIHDLRNPIAAIQGFTSLLSDNNSEEDKKLFIQMLNSSSNQLDVLISSLSNAYLDPADQKKIKFHNTNIKSLLTEIIQGFQYESKLKHIKIAYDLEEFEALVNKNALFTVLGNLLSNALKFSLKETEIFIQARKKEKHWELLIRDQGPGFSIADREKMFGMFTPLSAIPTNNEISTGLGLFSVKKTLQFIGGDIQLNTQYVEGAEFICKFPLNFENNQQED